MADTAASCGSVSDRNGDGYSAPGSMSAMRRNLGLLRLHHGEDGRVHAVNAADGELHGNRVVDPKAAGYPDVDLIDARELRREPREIDLHRNTAELYRQFIRGSFSRVSIELTPSGGGALSSAPRPEA